MHLQGLPTIQFSITCSMQKQCSIFHVNDVSVYLGRRGGGPRLKERISHTRSLFWTKSSTFFASWTFKTQALGTETTASSLFFRSGTPPSLCLHWRLSCDRMAQAILLRFCILQVMKNWMVGRPGNEANIGHLVPTASPEAQYDVSNPQYKP